MNGKDNIRSPFKKIAIASIFILTFNAQSSEILAKSGGNQKFKTVIGATKFGVAFIADDGDIVVGNELFLKISNYKYMEHGGSISFYSNSIGLELGKKATKTEQEKTGLSYETDRLLISVYGGYGICNQQYIVLDFTGTEPYASKPFGYNPDGTACLEFKKVKWGKNVSYIYLEGPMKYAYHTGGAVIGPLE